MPGPDDIVYDASINDRTETFFNKFDQRLTQMETRASGAFTRMEGGVKKFGAAAGIVGGVVGGVVGMIAGELIQAGKQALFTIAEFGTQAAQLRARADELAVVLRLVGNNAGYSDDEISTFEESLRKTGISILQTRKSLTQMIQAQLDLNQASKIARVAQDAAVISGINSSDAFDRIIRATTTLQPEMLRSMGLFFRMDEAMKEFAKQSGKNVNALTMQERQQAFLNATMKAGITVAGAYEAAMGTVGKKQRSLERVMEDLSVAFGAVYQPMMRIGVEAKMKIFEDLTKFLEDNEEALISLGETAADVFGKIIELLIQIADKLMKLPGQIKDLSMGIAQLLNGMSDEEMGKRSAKIGVWFGQVATLILGTVMHAVKSIGGLFDELKQRFELFKAYARGRISAEDYQQALADLDERRLAELQKSFNENMMAAAEFFGTLEKGEEVVEDTAKSTEGLAKSTEELTEAYEKANESLAKFYYSMQQDVIERQIQETRQNIEDALREAWRLEDIARKRAESINDILEDANDANEEAARQLAENKLDIERDYRRRLRDIQQDFEFQAEELARSRDAISLLRLMRQKDRELQEAKQSRDDAAEDNKIAYQRQLQDIERNRKEALQDLEKQLAEEEEAYQRSAEREEEIQRLHDQWEEEDRQRKYAQQLADLLENFDKQDAMTDEQLTQLYDKWDDYFGNLLELAKEKQAELNSILADTETTSADEFTSTTGGKPGPRTGPGQAGLVSQMLANPMQVIGQGGLVSQLLTSPSMIGGHTVPRVPFASAKRSIDRREVDVKVTGDVLDPYFQRVLVNALMEIERNR